MSSRKIKTGIGIVCLALLIGLIAFSIQHQPPISTHHKLSLNKNNLHKSITHKPLKTKAHHVTVQSGDTLASIFHKLHLSAATLEAVTAASLADTHLKNIHPGQTLSFYIDKHQQLQQLIFPFDNTSTLYISATKTGYTTDIKSKPVTIAIKYRSGTIVHSLAESTARAGLNLSLYNQLIEIFQGEIDFKHGIRHGDHFSILYQEYYIDGKKDHAGDIVAAEFINHGKTYKAVHYTYPKNHTGYYTPNGHGVQSLFLKTPVHYKRISGFFTYHRLDPYLHVMRPHLGIDYAAPRGTPIHSIGNGEIIFRGRDHGYGNAVLIRYSRKYKTLYGHMERFAKGQRVGQRVKRGEVIGYIGSTGWSTGPHLHFEIYVYGVPKNPLKMKFPGGGSIPKSYLQDYLVYAHKTLERMNLYQGPELAENGTQTTFKK